MPEPCTVLITSRQTASPFAEDGAPQGEVLTFDESQPLQALDLIAARQPEIVALDHEFASSPRGIALAERIKNDPLLASSRVVVVAADGQLAPFTAGRSPGPDPTVAQPVDRRGTRRVPRFLIRTGVQVLINGQDAWLIDLSVLGAQVLSRTVIRPNKAVRIVMPDETSLLRVSGVIVWARFEMAPGQTSPHYRAGMQFNDADPAALQQYCLTRRA
jgi:hypothetical protein